MNTIVDTPSARPRLPLLRGAAVGVLVISASCATAEPKFIPATASVTAKDGSKIDLIPLETPCYVGMQMTSPGVFKSTTWKNVAGRFVPAAVVNEGRERWKCLAAGETGTVKVFGSELRVAGTDHETLLPLDDRGKPMVAALEVGAFEVTSQGPSIKGGPVRVREIDPQGKNGNAYVLASPLPAGDRAEQIQLRNGKSCGITLASLTSVLTTLDGRSRPYAYKVAFSETCRAELDRAYDIGGHNVKIEGDADVAASGP